MNRAFIERSIGRKRLQGFGKTAGQRRAVGIGIEHHEAGCGLDDDLVPSHPAGIVAIGEPDPPARVRGRGGQHSVKIDIDAQRETSLFGG